MPAPSSPLRNAAAADVELVAASLAGDRAAFGYIVERYQRLLCSLAYSATGRLDESEDLAQEAFIEAWRQLGQLREPEKLRPWLCGIVRHRISRLRRRDGREPVREAAPLDASEEPATPDEPAMERLIKSEEQEILWSELQRVPEIYREPLVLYYREHQSIEHVASALDLTEDAVKQRLVRGRKILQERVLAFVEGALQRSTPGRVFTLSVLAALPELSTPAKAMGVAAIGTASQGTTLAKATGLATVMTALASVVNLAMQMRASLDQARTPRERRYYVQVSVGAFLGSLAVLGAVWLLREGAYRAWEQRLPLALVAQSIVVSLFVAWPIGVVKILQHSRRIRSEERLRHPESFLAERDRVGSTAGEYRSAWTLLGIPLVHARFASPDEGQRPVFGWIAFGDRAYGLLLAWGAWAVAPISVGGLSVGIFSVGAMSVGVISLGTFAVGGFAVGSFSLGYETYAWLSALGWDTAQRAGFGIARVAAEAPIAFAAHANDATARALLADPHAERNHMIFVSLILGFSMIPLAYYAYEVRRRLGLGRSKG